MTQVGGRETGHQHIPPSDDRVGVTKEPNVSLTTLEDCHNYGRIELGRLEVPVVRDVGFLYFPLILPLFNAEQLESSLVKSCDEKCAAVDKIPVEMKGSEGGSLWCRLVQ